MEHVKIDLTKLRNPEFLHYLQEYLLHLTTNDPALLHVAPEHAVLTSKANEIEAVLKQDTGSPITVNIEALDMERDSLLGSFYTLITGFYGHFDPLKKAAAFALKDRLNVYGTATEITNQSLQGETESIQNLVYDLQTIPVYSAALTTLGLSDWIAQIKVVNDDFASKYFERTEEIASQNPDRIKELRLEANPLFYQLRDMLMAQGLVAAYAAPFPKAINEVNALTQQYNATLSQRAGIANNNEPPVIPPDPIEPIP